MQLDEEWQQIQLAQTDPKHFESLYNTYHEQVFRYLYQRVNEVEIARDLLSQVFFKALVNLKKYEFKGVPFSSWLYRIAYSELHQSFRDNKAQKTINLNSSDLDLPEFLEDGDENTELRKKCLTECLKALKADKMELIEMRFFEKRSVREISEILDLSESNVKVKTHRALKELKVLLEQKLKNYEIN